MSAAKFWVALIMAIVGFSRSYSGVDLGVDDATANAIVGAVTAALVWIIPNKPKDPPFFGRSSG
jgi:hypothetical protein